jgi:hypothetical protein
MWGISTSEIIEFAWMTLSDNKAIQMVWFEILLIIWKGYYENEDFSCDPSLETFSSFDLENKFKRYKVGERFCYCYSSSNRCAWL